MVIQLSVIIPTHKHIKAYSSPPITSAETIVPPFLVKIFISQVSSEQTVYLLILRHHHSLHSSPHQQRNSNFPVIKKPSCYHTLLLEPSLQFISPIHQQSLLSLFLGKIIICKYSSEQTVYPLILRHHHSLNSSPHQQNNIFTRQKGYLIISCYPTPSENPILKFIPPPHQHSLLYPFYQEK